MKIDSRCICSLARNRARNECQRDSNFANDYASLSRPIYDLPAPPYLCPASRPPAPPHPPPPLSAPFQPLRAALRRSQSSLASRVTRSSALGSYYHGIVSVPSPYPSLPLPEPFRASLFSPPSIAPLPCCCCCCCLDQAARRRWSSGSGESDLSVLAVAAAFYFHSIARTPLGSLSGKPRGGVLRPVDVSPLLATTAFNASVRSPIGEPACRPSCRHLLYVYSSRAMLNSRMNSRRRRIAPKVGVIAPSRPQ
jgi:hypothetical protein